MKLFKVMKKKNTAKFYDQLMDGDENRGMWGKDARFSVKQIVNKPSVHTYFTNVVKEYVTKEDKVLDNGCGTGGFLSCIAPLCGTITGVDISERFVNETQKSIEAFEYTNASAQQVDGKTLPFDDETYDVVVMVDVIHHMENPHAGVEEAVRVLKSGGKLVIFEPNMLNPLLALLSALDHNEWGLLSLGRRSVYKKMFSPYVDIELNDYNGLLIGPDIKLFDALAEFMSKGIGKVLFGWMSPKLVIIGTKK